MDRNASALTFVSLVKNVQTSPVPLMCLQAAGTSAGTVAAKASAITILVMIKNILVSATASATASTPCVL